MIVSVKHSSLFCRVRLMTNVVSDEWNVVTSLRRYQPSTHWEANQPCTREALLRRYDTQHNDTQHNEIQPNDTQHNDTQQNDI